MEAKINRLSISIPLAELPAKGEMTATTHGVRESLSLLFLDPG